MFWKNGTKFFIRTPLEQQNTWSVSRINFSDAEEGWNWRRTVNLEGKNECWMKIDSQMKRCICAREVRNHFTFWTSLKNIVTLKWHNVARILHTEYLIGTMCFELDDLKKFHFKLLWTLPKEDHINKLCIHFHLWNWRITITLCLIVYKVKIQKSSEKHSIFWL